MLGLFQAFTATALFKRTYGVHAAKRSHQRKQQIKIFITLFIFV